MAADVYAEPPHIGRGGWTWYTGSAGWMYQAGVESILGLRLRGDDAEDRALHPARPGRATRSTIDHGPATTRSWWRTPTGSADGIATAELDGQPLPADASVALRVDGATHRLRVVLGDPEVR